VLDVQVWSAVLAGLIAGAVMEGPVYLQKALGLPVKQNIFRTWGNLLGLRGTGGYAAGLLFHEGLMRCFAAPGVRCGLLPVAATSPPASAAMSSGVLLVEADATQGARQADRLRAALHKAGVPATVGLGVRSTDRTLAYAWRQADQNMYETKRRCALH
jgi:hypothetical protein